MFSISEDTPLEARLFFDKYGETLVTFSTPRIKAPMGFILHFRATLKHIITHVGLLDSTDEYIQASVLNVLIDMNDTLMQEEVATVIPIKKMRELFSIFPWLLIPLQIDGLFVTWSEADLYIAMYGTSRGYTAQKTLLAFQYPYPIVRAICTHYINCRAGKLSKSLARVYNTMRPFAVLHYPDVAAKYPHVVW